MQPYYQDDLVTIYHGDCREIGEWLMADVLVTDPPYGMAYRSGWYDRRIVNDDDTMARDEALAMWGDGPALVFGRWSVAKPENVRACLIWDKGDWPGMGDLTLPWGPSTEELYVIGSGFTGKRGSSVIREPRLTGMTRHPNEKPVPLMRRLLRWCDPSWVVADPFMGSGSTLVAAKEAGRRAIGIEIDEKNCEEAANRCRQEVLGLSA